jgi:RND superfamily putative drug exporter
VDKQIDFSSAEGQTAVARLTDHLEANRRELGLADIRSLSAPLGITASAKTDLVRRDLPEEGREEVTKHAALEHYTTAMGERGKTGTRLELVLDWSPFARESVDNLPQLEQAVRAGLPEKMRSRSQLYFLGATASVRDLATVMQQDRSRIEVLVVAAVFVILVLLLRGFVISIYLLLSVIFSYFTALGVTFAVFWLADPSGFSGIDWRVAIFLFTILIAVGEDYNIFLMTRVDEEQKRFGPVRGITEALDRTGPIITSCGIIMAGTFASLLIVGSLTEMKQLGFALAFGVLLDTFVVRPILVPSFLIMLCTGRLPLLGRPKAAESVPPETTQARPCAEPMGTAGKADRQSQRAEPPLTPAQSMHDAASGGVHPRRAATPPG